MTSSGSTPSASRRRQIDRSAATTDTLLDATIEAIAEVGLARATTDEICRRAGVTQGALYHHFTTRRELLTAAIAHFDAQMRSEYEEVITKLTRAGSAVGPADLLAVVLAGVRSQKNLVWLELLLAARTDPDMLADISERLTAQWAMMRSLLAGHPAFADLAPEALDVWFDLVQDYLGGETIWSMATTRGDPSPLPSDHDKIATLVALAAALDPPALDPAARA